MGGMPPGTHGMRPGMWGPQVGWGGLNSYTESTDHWVMYNKMMQGLAPYVAPWGPPLPYSGPAPAPPSGYKSYNKSSSTQGNYTLGLSGELKYGGAGLKSYQIARPSLEPVLVVTGK